MTRRKSGSRSWWGNLPATIKTAIIGGCFSLLVGMLGIVGMIVVPLVVSHFQPKEPPYVTITSGGGGGEEYLYARGADGGSYFLTTNTCLHISGEGINSRTNYSADKWEGQLGILISTNRAIVVESLQLEVTGFSRIDQSNLRIIATGFGQGGFGEPVKIVKLPAITVGSNPTKYVLERFPYQFPNEGALFFSLPIILKQPGSYQYRILAKLNDYSGTLDSNMKASSLSSIEWVHIPSIDPALIDNASGGTITYQVCK